MVFNHIGVEIQGVLNLSANLKGQLIFVSVSELSIPSITVIDNIDTLIIFELHYCR